MPYGTERSLLGMASARRQQLRRDELAHLCQLPISVDNLVELSNDRGYVELDFRKLYMNELEKKQPGFAKSNNEDLVLIDPILSPDFEEDKRFSSQAINSNDSVDSEGFDLDDPFLDFDDYEETYIDNQHDTEHGGFYVNFGKADLKKITDSTENSKKSKKKTKENSISSSKKNISSSKDTSNSQVSNKLVKKSSESKIQLKKPKMENIDSLDLPDQKNSSFISSTQIDSQKPIEDPLLDFSQSQITDPLNMKKDFKIFESHSVDKIIDLTGKVEEVPKEKIKSESS